MEAAAAAAAAAAPVASASVTPGALRAAVPAATDHLTESGDHFRAPEVEDAGAGGKRNPGALDGAESGSTGYDGASSLKNAGAQSANPDEGLAAAAREALQEANLAAVFQEATYQRGSGAATAEDVPDGPELSVVTKWVNAVARYLLPAPELRTEPVRRTREEQEALQRLEDDVGTFVSAQLYPELGPNEKCRVRMAALADVGRGRAASPPSTGGPLHMSRRALVCRLFTFVDFVSERMRATGDGAPKLSVKWHAAGILTELYPLVVAVASGLNLIAVDYDDVFRRMLHNPLGAPADTPHPLALFGAVAGEDVNAELGWLQQLLPAVAPPTREQRECITRLRRFFSTIDIYAAKKESYVAYVATLQEEEINFISKFFVLEYLAKTIAKIQVKQASYLVTITVVVYAQFLHNDRLLQCAEELYRRQRRRGASAENAQPALPGGNAPPLSAFPSYSGFVAVLCVFMTNFARHLVGTAGRVVNREDEDAHRLGVGAVATFLGKVLTVIMLTESEEAASATARGGGRGLGCLDGVAAVHGGAALASPDTCCGAAWGPIASSILLRSAARFAVGSIVHLLRQTVFVRELAAIDVHAPTDDGSGQLEATPAAQALACAAATLGADALRLDGVGGPRPLPAFLAPAFVRSVQRAAAFVLREVAAALRAAAPAAETPAAAPATVLPPSPDCNLFNLVVHTSGRGRVFESRVRKLEEHAHLLEVAAGELRLGEDEGATMAGRPPELSADDATAGQVAATAGPGATSADTLR